MAALMRLLCRSVALLTLVLGYNRALAGIETPVTPGASPQARALLAWLGKQNGKCILSGQIETTPQPGEKISAEREFERVFKLTGKIPSIRVFDLQAASPVQYPHGKIPPLNVAQRAIAWWQSNGIVAVQWHWVATNRSGGWGVSVKSEDPDAKGWRGFDLDRALVSGTPEHDELLAGIDAAAAELARLRDAGVPVLWRPLPENSGGWFWWGAKGPESFKFLWKLMFERMTARHRLNNLLWVFNPAEPGALDSWYPGDEYVDAITLDRYAETGQHPSFIEEFEALNRFSMGRKLLGLSENGGIPDPDLLIKDGAGWAFFCTSPGTFILDEKVSPPEFVTQCFKHKYVTSREALPRLNELPIPPVGLAKRIGFVRQPVSICVGKTMSQPVTVAAFDDGGNVVREASGPVTLTVTNKDLVAPFTAFFVNGVATFAPAGFKKPAARIQFIANNEALGNAVSALFDARLENGGE